MKIESPFSAMEKRAFFVRTKGFYEGYASSEKLAPLVREIAWSHNLVILEYALFDATKPIGLATYRILKRLPKELKEQLPGPEEIARLLEDGG